MTTYFSIFPRRTESSRLYAISMKILLFSKVCENFIKRTLHKIYQSTYKFSNVKKIEITWRYNLTRDTHIHRYHLKIDTILLQRKFILYYKIDSFSICTNLYVFRLTAILRNLLTIWNYYFFSYSSFNCFVSCDAHISSHGLCYSPP